MPVTWSPNQQVPGPSPAHQLIATEAFQQRNIQQLADSTQTGRGGSVARNPPPSPFAWSPRTAGCCVVESRRRNDLGVKGLVWGLGCWGPTAGHYAREKMFMIDALAGTGKT